MPCATVLSSTVRTTTETSWGPTASRYSSTIKRTKRIERQAQNSIEQCETTWAKPADEGHRRDTQPRPGQAQRHGKHPDERQAQNSIEQGAEIPRPQRGGNKHTAKDEKYQKCQELPLRLSEFVQMGACTPSTVPQGEASDERCDEPVTTHELGASERGDRKT